MENVNKLTCDVCQKTFVTVSSKNRHLRNMHNMQVGKNMLQRIRCSLCPEEKKEAFQYHELLLNHLTEIHGVTIKQSDLAFRNIAEFESWMSKENRQVDYACVRRNKLVNCIEVVYYNCNRSNSFGYKSQCTVRAEKLGGSIKISGMCPSRIIVKIFRNGSLSAKFIETHVGHGDEYRTKRLMKQEQTMIVDQLQAGVSTERILNDARKSTCIDSERRIQIERENIVSKVNALQGKSLDDFINIWNAFENSQRDNKNEVSKKRKIEKQTYFPNKK